MQRTLFFLAALLGLHSPREAGGEWTDRGHCSGAVSDEVHASSLLQVKGAHAEGLNKVPAATEAKEQPKTKCDPTVKSSNKVLWEKAQASEVSFWDSVIAKYGNDFERFNRDTQIRDAFRPYLDLPDNASQSAEIKLLNFLVVGSGPGSDIGYNDYEDAKVNLVLTDPLAQMYAGIYKKHNAYPPQRVIPLPGEELECFFAPNFFNMVYSANALDHSYDPLEAMRQMVRVAVPCAWIVVELFQNEANAEKGSGLHQWDFHMEDSRVTLERYNTTTVYDINDEMHKVGAEMSATFEGCYLHGGLHGSCQSKARLEKKQLRMKIRKLGADGQKCPVSRVGF